MFGNNAGGFGGDELGDLGGYGGNDFAGGAAGGYGGDAGGAGGLGGYLASQATQAQGQGDGQQRTANKGNGVILCVNCNLINQAGKELTSMDSKVVIHGQQVDICNLVAQIHSGTDLRNDPSPSSLAWQVTDGSGMVTVKSMQSPDELEPLREEFAKLIPGAYVRVCGPIRTFNGQIHVQAYKIRAIEHFNEVANHQLAVITEYMHLSGHIPCAAERKEARIKSTMTVPANSGGMFPAAAGTPTPQNASTNAMNPGASSAPQAGGNNMQQQQQQQQFGGTAPAAPFQQGGQQQTFGQAAPQQQQNFGQQQQQPFGQQAPQVGQPSNIKQIEDQLLQWVQSEKEPNGQELETFYRIMNGSIKIEHIQMAAESLVVADSLFVSSTANPRRYSCY